MNFIFDCVDCLSLERKTSKAKVCRLSSFVLRGLHATRRMAGKEAASSALKVVVFLGTVRENNYGSRAAKFMVKKLSEKGHSVTLLGKHWLSCQPCDVVCSETVLICIHNFCIWLLCLKLITFLSCKVGSNFFSAKL